MQFFVLITESSSQSDSAPGALTVFRLCSFWCTRLIYCVWSSWQVCYLDYQPYYSAVVSGLWILPYWGCWEPKDMLQRHLLGSQNMLKCSCGSQSIWQSVLLGAERRAVCAFPCFILYSSNVCACHCSWSCHTVVLAEYLWLHMSGRSLVYPPQAAWERYFERVSSMYRSFCCNNFSSMCQGPGSSLLLDLKTLMVVFGCTEHHLFLIII